MRALALLALAYLLSGSKLIGEEAILSDSAVQYKLVTAARDAFVKESQRNAEVYYPRMQILRVRESGARMVGVYTRVERPILEGEALISYRLEESNAEKVRLEQSLEGLRKAHEVALDALKAREEALQRAIAQAEDPLEREILRIEREELSLEREKASLDFEYQGDVLREQISEKEKRLHAQEMIAPFDGAVKAVTPRRAGESLYFDEPLIQIYADDTYLLRVEDSASQLRYNMPVVIEIGPRSSRTYLTGRVVAADNILKQEFRVGSAYIKFDELPEESAKNLIFPQVDIKSSELYNVLLAPRKAVSLEKGAQYVSILDEGQVKKRIVNVAATSADACLIIGGLDEGDQLILK
jgi:hypothetical protein